MTVANSIHDLLDKPLDPAHLTAKFFGFVTPAQLVLNEVDPNIKGSHDLVELRDERGNVGRHHPSAGPVSKTMLATLPAIQVAVDDLIVVHLTPAVP